MEEAERIKKIPLYLFTIMDKLKLEAISKGNDVIDLGMGNPDLPTPKHIVDELCMAAQKLENHFSALTLFLRLFATLGFFTNDSLFHIQLI